jgi:hypothetical protein
MTCGATSQPGAAVHRLIGAMTGAATTAMVAVGDQLGGRSSPKWALTIRDDHLAALAASPAAERDGARPAARR